MVADCVQIVDALVSAAGVGKFHVDIMEIPRDGAGLAPLRNCVEFVKERI